MSKTLWIVIAVIAVVLIGGWWYMMKHSTVEAPATVTPTVTQQPAMMESSSPMASASGAMSGQSVTITGSEFMFTPSTFSAKVGEPVTVVFKNAGSDPHNFTISELDVETKTIGPGATDTVTFTPTKAGTYIFFCSVPGHEEKGMKGTLTVS